MDTSLQEFLRISPYRLSHILKYEPSALLSESDMKSNTLIQTHKTQFSQNGWSMVNEGERVCHVDQPCYFCGAKSTMTGWPSCGECRRAVCGSCVFRCGKCEKVLCQLDKTYDYNQECVCCFNC